MRYRSHSRYRSYRYRGWNNAPSKFSILQRKFGPAVYKIKDAFFHLDHDRLDELLKDYGSFHGKSAERYARASMSAWRSSSKAMSGQTMERLVELVPPYLEPTQRLDILDSILKHNKAAPPSRTVTVNIKKPEEGLAAIDAALATIAVTDELAHLPPHVMDAATWLYDDDVTAARAVLTKLASAETEALKQSATRELELLKRTIRSGQVQSASYEVKTPGGSLFVRAEVPSKCFVATVAFGEMDPRTETLRQWRDGTLSQSGPGLAFTSWYYRNGEMLARRLGRRPASLTMTRMVLTGIVTLLRMAGIDRPKGETRNVE